MVALSLSPSCLVFGSFFWGLFSSLFYKKTVLMFSHIIYNVGLPSLVQQVGFMCLLHHSLLYLHLV